MGHQFRLLREVPPERLEEYKRGAVLRDGPVRIVRVGFGCGSGRVGWVGGWVGGWAGEQVRSDAQAGTNHVIAEHTSKDRTYMKKSALRNPRGISRNVLGGFCTS
eukprot:jgi/Undpi1/8021/HiC_scaffold_24.g10493.m1